MDVQQRAHIVPASLSRLTVFTAGSIALHALTLSAYAPAGVMSSPNIERSMNVALQATLLPAERETIAQNAEATSSEARPVRAESEISPATPGSEDRKSNTPDLLATAPPRAGVPEGRDIPLPDKWFTAQEVDVRAEPLTAAELVYPSELMRSGPVGRVRVMLFIDERGMVRKTYIAASSPETLFDAAAVNAWKHVRFSPAEKNGVAVKSQKLLEMEFMPF